MSTMTLTALSVLRVLSHDDRSLACGLCIPYRCSCDSAGHDGSAACRSRASSRAGPNNIPNAAAACLQQGQTGAHRRTNTAQQHATTSRSPSPNACNSVDEEAHSTKPVSGLLPTVSAAWGSFSTTVLQKLGVVAPVATHSARTIKASKLQSAQQSKLASAAAAVAAAQRRRSDSSSKGTVDATAAATTLPSSSSVSSALSSASACPKCHSSSPRPFESISSGCRFCQIVTEEELAKHTTLESRLWLCISGVVYDVTPFAHEHPGGLLPLLDTAGADCTDVFKVFHSNDIIDTRLPRFRIGVMGTVSAEGKARSAAARWEATPMQTDFHAMIERIEEAGLFRTNFAWYWSKVLALAGMLSASLCLLWFAEGRFAFHMLAAFFLGLFWQQLAFMGHDLGHNSVRGTADRDRLAGWIVTIFFGVSVQWWKRSHNVHHVVTNELQHDPDIQYLPVFAFSEKMLQGFWSTYHERFFAWSNVASKLVRFQHLLYWPVMGVARMNLYVQSMLLVADAKKAVPYRGVECVALLCFWVWHLALLYFLVPDFPTRVLFWIVAHNVAGLTHVQITLSHFAMPIVTDHYSASSAPERREHFLRSQFATTMDVDCPESWDWIHGGLQFQLTHHLLPRVPRHALREVRERFVKPFAQKHGIEYKQETFWEANKTVYRRMKAAADASRLLPQQAGDSMLWQFINADG